MERYRADERPQKISLAQGVFVDESGTTPLLETVREAEARMLAVPTSKVYKPIDGDPAYRRVVRDLIFGADHAIVTDRRVEVLHTPGGTGALRVAGDLIPEETDGTRSGGSRKVARRRFRGNSRGAVHGPLDGWGATSNGKAAGQDRADGSHGTHR